METYFRYWKRGWWALLLMLCLYFSQFLVLPLALLAGVDESMQKIAGLLLWFVLGAPLCGWIFEVFAGNSRRIAGLDIRAAGAVDWIAQLGKHVDALPRDLNHGGAETLFLAEDGGDEENPLVIAAADFSWEARLSADQRIATIFLDARRGIALPLGLHASFTRAQVRALLGVPKHWGEASVVPVLGYAGAWDRFDAADHCLHVEYVADGSIGRVTLMRPDVAP